MNESIDKLVGLAKEVGGAAWPMMVRYELLGGAVEMGAALVVAVASALSLRWVWRHKFEDDFNGDFAKPIVSAIASIGLAVALLMTTDALLSLMCPEGAVLHSLLVKK